MRDAAEKYDGDLSTRQERRSARSRLRDAAEKYDGNSGRQDRSAYVRQE